MGPVGYQRIKDQSTECHREWDQSVIIEKWIGQLSRENGLDSYHLKSEQSTVIFIGIGTSKSTVIGKRDNS